MCRKVGNDFDAFMLRQQCGAGSCLEMWSRDVAGFTSHMRAHFGQPRKTNKVTRNQASTYARNACVFSTFIAHAEQIVQQPPKKKARKTKARVRDMHDDDDDDDKRQNINDDDSSYVAAQEDEEDEEYDDDDDDDDDDDEHEQSQPQDDNNNDEDNVPLLR